MGFYPPRYSSNGSESSRACQRRGGVVIFELALSPSCSRKHGQLVVRKVPFHFLGPPQRQDKHTTQQQQNLTFEYIFNLEDALFTYGEILCHSFLFLHSSR